MINVSWGGIERKTYKIPLVAHFNACSKSASSKMIVGLFPPNSSETTFKFVSAEALRSLLPVRRLPVSPTFRTLGCAPMAAPVIGPEVYRQPIKCYDNSMRSHTLTVDDVDHARRKTCFIE